MEEIQVGDGILIDDREIELKVEAVTVIDGCGLPTRV